MLRGLEQIEGRVNGRIFIFFISMNYVFKKEKKIGETGVSIYTQSCPLDKEKWDIKSVP